MKYLAFIVVMLTGCRDLVVKCNHIENCRAVREVGQCDCNGCRIRVWYDRWGFTRNTLVRPGDVVVEHRTGDNYWITANRNRCVGEVW